VIAEQANRGRLNSATLRQITEEYNRNFTVLQKTVKDQRQAIKDFDKKQDDKKNRVFDVSIHYSCNAHPSNFDFFRRWKF
jgi:flagellar biosynthesis chaperone FliJ